MVDPEPLGGEYLLHEEIGRGALAVVRRATSRFGGPPLAAKLLRPEFAGDRRVRDLFLREEAALRDLDHPAIVGIRDLVVERGRLALVMDYVDGPNLRRHLGDRGGRLPVAEAAGIAAQAAAALAAAHAQGVVHLDLKPENLLLVRGTDARGTDARGTGPPVVRITDFGVAALLLDADREVVGGTPGYIAPEALRGGPVTAAADVYSLGALLVELVQGVLPGDPELLPEPLRTLARECLAADPRARPSARAVAASLRSAATFQAAPTAAGDQRDGDLVPRYTGPRGLSDRDFGHPATGRGDFAGRDGGPGGFGGQAADPGDFGGQAAGPGGFGGQAAGPGGFGGQAAGPGGFGGPDSGPGDFGRPAAGPGGFGGRDSGQRDTRLRPGVTAAAAAAPPEPPPVEERWRRGPLLTLAGAAVVAALLVGVNATSDKQDRPNRAAAIIATTPAASAEPGPETPAPPANLPPTEGVAAVDRTRVTFVGHVENDAGTLAISLRDGVAIAYICDGDRVEAWLRGTAAAGRLSLKGKNGAAITATFDAARARGRVTVIGRTNAFTLAPAKKPSGLYRTAAKVRNAKVVGSWIVLPDGRQVGVLTEGDAIGPAPALDVTGRTATVDGAAVRASSVDVDSGEGF